MSSTMDTFACLFLVVKILPIASLSRTKHDIVFVHPTTLSQVIPVSPPYLPIYGFQCHSKYISHGLLYLDSKSFMLLSMLGMEKYLWGNHELERHN